MVDAASEQREDGDRVEHVRRERKTAAARLREVEPRDIDESMIHGVLTSREFQVAMRLVEGINNRDIAKELRLSTKTIDTHRQHILKKLCTKNNVTLARMFWRAGICVL